MTGVGEGMRRHQFRERWGGERRSLYTPTGKGYSHTRLIYLPQLTS
ncbi:hypothetical protein [Limnospira fusiformis]